MDVGVMGINGGGNGSPYGTAPSSGGYSQGGGAVYGRITINLDAEKPSVDCGRLYELELLRLQLEIEQAKLIGSGRPVSTK